MQRTLHLDALATRKCTIIKLTVGVAGAGAAFAYTTRKTKRMFVHFLISAFFMRHHYSTLNAQVPLHVHKANQLLRLLLVYVVVAGKAVVVVAVSCLGKCAKC